jgi:ribosomal-protein-alanine N-acetyltransferase
VGVGADPVVIQRSRPEAHELHPALAFAPMQREDVAAVLEIERLSYDNPWSPEFFLQELRLPFSKVLLARVRVGNEPCLAGYICRWLTADELHILNLAVHPGWRRRSVGYRLAAEVIAEARCAGALRATLEVRRRNFPALSLYEGLGFFRVGVRMNYYGQGEDALVMELGLAPG